MKGLYSKTNLERCQKSEYLFKNTKECNAMQAHMKTLFETHPIQGKRKKKGNETNKSRKNGYRPATYLN